jgi:hypothetical protein
MDDILKEVVFLVQQKQIKRKSHYILAKTNKPIVNVSLLKVNLHLPIVNLS